MTIDSPARALSARLWGNEHLRAALAIGILTLVFFSPVLRHHGSFSAVYAHQRGVYPWLKGGDPPVFSLHDQADYVYPRQVFLDRSLKEDGEIPLWNPLTFGGHPFFAETGSRIAYLPFLLVSMALSPILMHDVYLMIHVFGAGLAMFALMKHFRVRFGGALLAATAWAFSSYGLLYYMLEMYAAVAALLPLVVLLVHRWHERRSWPSLAAAGLLLGALYLGTSAELAFMSYLFVFVYAVALAGARFVRERHSLDIREVAALVAAPAVLMGIAVAVAAVGLLPFVDLSARSGRVPMSYPDILKDFPHLGFDDFARVVRPPDTPLTVKGVSQQVFLGTATGLLALAGAFYRGPAAALGRSLVVVLFVYAIGGPGTWLAYQLPGLNRLHGVGRAMFLFNLGLAMLAGIGLDQALRWWHRRKPHEPTGTAPPERPARPGRSALAYGVTALCVLTAYLQLFDYGRDIHPPFQPRDSRFLLPPTPATEAARTVLDKVEGGGRLTPVIRHDVPPALGYTLPAATGMALDLPTTGGYEPVLPERIASLWRLMSGEPLRLVKEKKLKDTALHGGTAAALARVDLFPRLGVGAVLGPPTMTEEPDWNAATAARRGLRLAYEGPDGVVYEVVNRTPRAFVVHAATWSRSGEESLDRFESAGFDVRREVILEDRPRAGDEARSQPAPRDMAPATVRWLDDRPNRVRVSVDSPAAGWLVLLDSWDPGWKATVAGRAAPVLRANYGFRAVRVEPGPSAVTFSYRPAPVVAGAWISAVATTAVLVFLVAGPARRRWERRGRTGLGASTVAAAPPVGMESAPPWPARDLA